MTTPEIQRRQRQRGELKHEIAADRARLAMQLESMRMQHALEIERLSDMLRDRHNCLLCRARAWLAGLRAARTK